MRSVQYVPINELTPDPRNPKGHDLVTIDQSIQRFGMLDPIVRDERTGYLISGHGRLQTLKNMNERGESPPEGVTADESGEWLVPVVVGWSSRTDGEAAAALIALNRTTELGGWVDDDLLALLDTLGDVEGGLEGVGFDNKEIEDLRRALGKDHLELDRLASEWDGTSGISAAGTGLTIVVQDSEVASRWAEHRDGHASDDEALALLLDEVDALS